MPRSGVLRDMIRRCWIAGLVCALALPCACVSATAAGRAAADASSSWTALHRPLHLPVLAAGASCPVSRTDRSVNWPRAHIFGRTGIGPGPVYPGLGFVDGRIHATPDTQYGGRWFGEKVFWYVLPRYRGPVLIRGRRLDGPQRLGFNGARAANTELRISPLDSVTWQGQPHGSRGVASGLRMLTAGCYGIQIDGTNFSRTLVVGVTLVH
jgi:hypothetical protein